MSSPAATDAAPPALRVPGWASILGLVHGFFGRPGGASSGAFASLNLSDAVGDEPAATAENWRRIGLAFPGLTVLRMRQVHGERVLTIDDAHAAREDADGMVTQAGGVAMGVLTADCVPILGVAPTEHTAMALHAGWRGALAGIAAAGAREAQQSLGVSPGDWQIAMGPSIGGCCYEVEAEIGQQFVDRWGAMPDAWQPAGAHGQLDLRAANRHILIQSGVPESQISSLGPCTACHSEEYFSHRRSAGRAGRQLSVIGWQS